jgi:hypothetical protein
MMVNDTSSMWCGCDCCFELEIKATGVPDTNFILIYEIEEDTISKNGEFGTQTNQYLLKQSASKYIFPKLSDVKKYREVNQKNDDGERIGLWEFYYEENKRINIRALYREDEEGYHRIEWKIIYDEEGNISEVCAVNYKDNSTCITIEDYLRLMENKP